MSPSNIGSQSLSTRTVAPTVLQIRKGPMLEDAPVVPAAVPYSSPVVRCSLPATDQQQQQQDQPKPSWHTTLQLAELYLQRQKYEAGIAVMKPLLLHYASEADVHCLHGKLLANLEDRAGVRAHCAYNATITCCKPSRLVC